MFRIMNLYNLIWMSAVIALWHLIFYSFTVSTHTHALIDCSSQFVRSIDSFHFWIRNWISWRQRFSFVSVEWLICRCHRSLWNTQIDFADCDRDNTIPDADSSCACIIVSRIRSLFVGRNSSRLCALHVRLCSCSSTTAAVVTTTRRRHRSESCIILCFVSKIRKLGDSSTGLVA